LKESYRTIAKSGEGIYKEKGSKFLAYSYSVENEEEIAEKIEALKKKYHDARHHCYAWKLGLDNQNYRANDDGEPANSAGKPILGQIESYQLTNVLILVVRYFGGVKLGVGGLIQAYKAAAKDALEDSSLVTKKIYSKYNIVFSYDDMNLVMRLLKKYHARTIDQKFEVDCCITTKVPVALKKDFEKAFLPCPAISLEYSEEG